MESHDKWFQNRHVADSDSSRDEGSRDNIEEIIHLIRRLVQAAYQYTKELDRNYNVSAPQLSSLRALESAGPLSLSNIARRLMVQSSTMTGIVDRLERKGLVRRVRTSADRRVITIELTPSGRDLVRNAPPPMQQQVVDGLKQRSPDQLEEIIRSLRLLTSMLDDDHIDSLDSASQPDDPSLSLL